MMFIITLIGKMLNRAPTGRTICVQQCPFNFQDAPQPLLTITQGNLTLWLVRKRERRGIGISMPTLLPIDTALDGGGVS